MPPSVFRTKNNRSRRFIFGETGLSAECTTNKLDISFFWKHLEHLHILTDAGENSRLNTLNETQLMDDAICKIGYAWKQTMAKYKYTK